MIDVDKNFEVIKSIEQEFRFVRINREKIPLVVSKIAQTEQLDWSADFIFKENSWKGINHLTIFSLLSYCFWDSDDWYFIHSGKKIWGSYALFYALNRAIQNDLPLYSQKFLEELEFDAFKEILRGENNSLPKRTDERFKLLKSFSTQLSAVREGKVSSLIEDCKYNAIDFHQALYEIFPVFRDQSFLYGEKVYFLKKSMEVVSLIYEQFKGEGLGKLLEAQKLIGSSDYKIPQILFHLGVLDYSGELKRYIKGGKIFKEEDIEILELRASTILAIRLLSLQSNRYSDIEISNRLWNLSKSSSSVIDRYPLYVLSQRF